MSLGNLTVAKVGLHNGNILTKIDNDAVDSPETLRRLLRRHVAWEEEMTFHFLRDGKKLQVRIPRTK